MAPKSLKKNGSNRENARSPRRIQDATPANQLEIAIGQQVRAFRKQLHMTVAEVAHQAGLSPGMLSKIENGLTSPSLATLKALSGALNVPVTAFFRKYEEERDATFNAATDQLRRQMLIDALAAAEGNQTLAGVMLGMHERQRGATTGRLDTRARKLAHRKFGYWWTKLVKPLESST